MRCYPRLGCPIVDEIAAIVSAPELANTPASSSKQAARATPKGLAPPALCYIRPDKLPFSWPTCIQIVFRPEKGLFLWPWKIYQAVRLV